MNDETTNTGLTFPKIDDDSKPNLAELRLESVVEELGGDSPDDLMLKVYKIERLSNEKIWQVDLPASAMPLEPILTEEYGGGKFEIHVYVKTATGRACKRRVPMHVREKPKQKQDDRTESDRFERMLAAISDSNKNTLQAIAEQQKLHMEVLATKLGGNSGGGLTIDSLTQLLPLIKQLLPSQKTESPIALVKEVLALSSEIRKTASENGVGDDSLGSTALKGLEMIRDLVKHAPQQVHYQPNPARELPVAAESIEQQPIGDDDMKFIHAALAEHLKFLVKQAENERDTAVYANYVLDQVPEPFYGMLLELLGDDDDKAVSKLAEIVPAVADYRPWFAEVCGMIRDAIVVDDKAGELTPGAQNGNNAAVNTGKAPHAKSGEGAREPANKDDSASHTAR